MLRFKASDVVRRCPCSKVSLSFFFNPKIDAPGELKGDGEELQSEHRTGELDDKSLNF